MDALMKYIGRINRAAILHRSRLLKDDGVNGIAHSYILRICQQPGITQDELSKALYVHKSNVARQIAMLEEGGYLLRKPKEGDKRVLCIYPTEKMLAIYPKIRTLLDDWNTYLLEDFTLEQAELLIDMLCVVLQKAQMQVEADEGSEAKP